MVGGAGVGGCARAAGAEDRGRTSLQRCLHLPALKLAGVTKLSIDQLTFA